MSYGRKFKIVWLGLDKAGKTTLINRLATGSYGAYTQPTVGMYTQEYLFGNTKYISWDVSGQTSFRERLWNIYLRGSSGVIWVIDSSDRVRFPIAKKEIWKYVFENRNLKIIPVLIFANKQDLKNAVKVKDVKKALDLGKIKKWPINVYPTSATTGVNLYEGLDWIRDKI